MKFKKVKGTADIFNWSDYNAVNAAFQKEFLANSFTEINVPILEHRSIFDKSVGQESDVALKEMFVIENRDPEDTDKICLRPELTTSFVRAYLEAGTEGKNSKFFCSGPVFRHERPQKGRFRQFNQINAELINCKEELYDAHVLALLYSIFKSKFGLDQFVLEVNYLGTKENQRLYNAYLKDFFSQNKDLCQFCQVKVGKNALKIFDCKNQGCQEQLLTATTIVQFSDSIAREAYDKLLTTLTLLGVSVVQNEKLVRGLDYYQGLVFEFKTTLLGSQGTFCAGGRYDIGFVFDRAEPLPCFGVGIGLERVVMLLKEAGIVLEQPRVRLLAVIAEAKDEKCKQLAILIAHLTWLWGYRTECLIENKTFGKGFEQANKLGASIVIIIGQSELETGSVSVKDMACADQATVAQGDLKAFLIKKFDKHP